MADNQINEQVKQDNAAVAPIAGKKKVTIGYVFFSLIPLAVFLMIETVCQMPFIILSIVDVTKETKTMELNRALNFTERFMEVFNERYAFYAYLLYAVVGLVVFGIWYYKAFVKKGDRVKFSQCFGVKSVVATVLVVVGFYFSINAVLTLISQLLPELMASYNEILELAGIGTNPLVTLIYAVLLGPVLEELVFRGVIYSYLEKSGIRPTFIILITGIMFGFVHLNVVQGTYAAVLGFLFGFLRYKYRSIKLTIFAHILLNFTGTYGEMALLKLGLSDSVLIILGGIALFVIVFAVVLVNGDKKAFKASNESKEQLN